MSRDNGSVIGVDNTPTLSAASGVWSMNAVARAVKEGIWPVAASFSDATLSLAFDETTTLDSRITFTRATSATYFDSSGVLQTASSGAARFDHRLEGGVWVNKGLLIEEQRTNVCLQSENLATTWANTNTTETTDATTAPDGNTTADAIFETTATGLHTISQGLASLDMISANYTSSCFFKANGRTRAIYQIFHTASGVNNFRVDFNLSDQTLSTVVGGTGVVEGTSITDVGNGWYRVSVSGRTGQSGGQSVRLLLQQDDGTFNYAGDDTKGMYMWGAQVEAGAFPTSYIKTTTASVTRNKDEAVMTGTDFSDWYNATEGTVFCEASTFADTGTGQRRWSITDGTTSNRLTEFFAFASPDETITLQNRISGVDGFNPAIAITYAENQLYKSCAAYKQNDFGYCVEASAVSTDTSENVTTANKLVLGANQATGNITLQINGHLAKFYYWNTRKSNTFLTSITS